jgi:hypothetical protein
MEQRQRDSLVGLFEGDEEEGGAGGEVDFAAIGSGLEGQVRRGREGGRKGGEEEGDMEWMQVTATKGEYPLHAGPFLLPSLPPSLPSFPGHGPGHQL